MPEGSPDNGGTITLIDPELLSRPNEVEIRGHDEMKKINNQEAIRFHNLLDKLRN